MDKTKVLNVKCLKKNDCGTAVYTDFLKSFKAFDDNFITYKYEKNLYKIYNIFDEKKEYAIIEINFNSEILKFNNGNETIELNFYQSKKLNIFSKNDNIFSYDLNEKYINLNNNLNKKIYNYNFLDEISLNFINNKDKLTYNGNSLNYMTGDNINVKFYNFNSAYKINYENKKIIDTGKYIMFEFIKLNLTCNINLNDQEKSYIEYKDNNWDLEYNIKSKILYDLNNINLFN